MVGTVKREFVSVERKGPDEIHVTVKYIQNNESFKRDYLNLKNIVEDSKNDLEHAPEFKEKRELELVKQQQDVQMQLDALPSTVNRRVSEVKQQLENAEIAVKMFEPLAKPLVDADPKPVGEVAK